MPCYNQKEYTEIIEYKRQRDPEDKTKPFKTFLALPGWFIAAVLYTVLCKIMQKPVQLIEGVQK